MFVLVMIIVMIVVIVVIARLYEKNKQSQMSPQELGKYLAAHEEKRLQMWWGQINPMMVCPHCNEKGKIRTMSVNRKKGISGSKATAAIFTAGFSMLATGLSKKEGLTQAHCCNCNNTWDF